MAHVNIEQVRQEIASLEAEIKSARSKEREYNEKLQPLGARKRNKPPKIIAEIQSEIDALRAEKEKAIALQKNLKSKVEELKQKLEKLERVEKLNQQQAQRDKDAVIQNNGSGKSPSKKRDISWKI
jgi:uncharacterized coiled-coil DUF342 family protein